MSTIFNIRNLKLPQVSRTAVTLGVVVVVLALVGVVAGREVYQKLTTNTVVAYFTEANALYAGDKVQIMGVRVGSIDKIEPAGDRMKVTFHYSNKYKVPADASVAIVNPSLVASRVIELTPPYRGGPVLADNAVIPLERTQVPVEWDNLRDRIANTLDKLGPTPDQPKGPFGDVIESLADGLAGKGNQINTTLTSLSDALTALNKGRGDFFAVLRSLALFVNAMHQNHERFTQLNTDLAQFTTLFTNTGQELADATQQFDSLIAAARKFFDDNAEVLTHDVNNLEQVTTAVVQPDRLDGLETALHIFPTMAANFQNIYQPAHGGVVGLPALLNFANPLQLICSAIQAGSRLGYQESAELCAQYLAPILDAIKFNYPPFGVNLVSTAAALPKHIAYSEERLRPPPGYKDTTVPGIFSPDTPFSHGNHEPGWVVAPGMQGVEVSPFTRNMLTPESLAELLGGPDIAPPPPGQNMAGPPNAYNESSPLPPPWYPQPGPPPGPAPGVVPGPVPGGSPPAGPPAPPPGPLAAEASAPAGPGQ
ncbi:MULTISPECIES: virulence factor Mce family protein [unclassified Mycobacterium]|uniref:virulence factor Mce family protein n=1 Tax=unclassified Mycobacterium TaxID=2642494 RepID=UPI00073FF992|nr:MULTISPECIES: virulence factor Mce family protein [unclassified Mycobacterium]KUH82866.1 mammalian cell entry protein [Mycobacterium sp. IS-1556]KUH83354.1 mammalian cell entry protein [Mycobacterium sp. GA-0227b]KUH84234.1 mammalian cell entry protein [Mycobacterium sp. GA-1999]